jgi:pseudouridine synthase
MSKFRYFVFNKPYGIVSQFTGEVPSETLSVFNLPKGLYAAGRLDKDSEGLLLLTNDGDFINKLINPKFEKEKTYHVQVENIPTQESLTKLKNGLAIEDYVTKKCQAKVLTDINYPPRTPPIRERKTIPTCWLEIKITEGKNRQVRKMTAKIGHPTLRLIRVQIGKLSIGDLASGEFREIKKEEII